MPGSGVARSAFCHFIAPCAAGNKEAPGIYYRSHPPEATPPGFSYDEVKHYHKRWVDDYLGNGKNIRDDKWTMSIAVGNKSFVERVKSLMGVLAIGRKRIEDGESYQLREPPVFYGPLFGVLAAA